MTDIYIIGGVVLLIVAGFFVIPFIKSKGLLSDKNIKKVYDSINVVDLIIDILPITDKYKNKANFALNVADKAVDYINEYANGTMTKDDKIVLSLKVIDSILEQYGVNASKSEFELVRIIVEQGIEYAEKIGK